MPLLLLWSVSCMRRIKLVRRQHLSEKATPVAANRCVVHQEWSWVRRGGFAPLSTSKHLWMLCKANEFAVGQGKDMSYQEKVQAAFVHLDLNTIILLETLKEQSQSPPPGMQLRSSISRSPAALLQTCCFHASQSAWYQLNPAIVQPG